jgi:hypothetical protein
VKDDKTKIVTIKVPLNNEIVDWDDAVFFIIPNLGPWLKKLEDVYVKKF